MLGARDFMALDANAKHFGINPFMLMENAGKRAAEELRSRFSGREFLFVCGSGNNGGDGFVATRILNGLGEIARVFCASEPKTLEARRALRLLPAECLVRAMNLDDYDVIVDCLLGVGIEGEPREPYASLIGEINNSGKIVVAMDVPSGFGTAGCIRAHLTITFHKSKAGLEEDKTVVKDIGIPEELEHVCGPGDVRAFFPRSAKESHKGQNGRVAVVGGGPYTGAPMISAMAALRSGADLVYLCVPDEILGIESSFEPSLIVRALDKTPVDDIDSILIGPGLGEGDVDKARELLDISLNSGKRVVCDATMLRALPRLKRGCIITPHLGEFSLLGGKERSEEEVMRIAREKDCTVILKGSIDLISDGARLKKNLSGHPTMTRGGTGDALAGLCAGLLSRSEDAFECACMAAYINGECGELAFREMSYGYTTTEMVNRIPEVLRWCME